MAQALYIMRRRDVAEEVLQEAFVRIWLRAGDFDPARGRPMAWMCMILRTAAIDHLRKERLAARYQADIEAADMLEAPVEPLDWRLDLSRGLSQLPVEQMRAVIAVTVEGRTHTEVAADAMMPVPTCKARVARGLRRMRTFLTAHEQSPQGIVLASQ